MFIVIYNLLNKNVRVETMKNIKCYLLDIDGTVSLGEKMIDGADKFIEHVRSEGNKIIFMTNNSSKNGLAYKAKLGRMGIDASTDDIFTSGDATIYYLNDIKKGSNVFLLGNEFLQEDFVKAGFNLVTGRDEDVDFVVLGFDTTLTYEKIWIACDYIRAGVTYIATHPDLNCPLAGGKWMPDTGAMIEMIYASTGVRPKIIGKPNKLLVEIIKKKFNFKASEMAMVGDRLYTDMMLGDNAGIKKVLVLSGETDLLTYEKQDKIKVDYVLNSIKDLLTHVT